MIYFYRTGPDVLVYMAFEPCQPSLQYKVINCKVKWLQKAVVFTDMKRLERVTKEKNHFYTIMLLICIYANRKRKKYITKGVNNLEKY